MTVYFFANICFGKISCLPNTPVDRLNGIFLSDLLHAMNVTAFIHPTFLEGVRTRAVVLFCGKSKQERRNEKYVRSAIVKLSFSPTQNSQIAIFL